MEYIASKLTEFGIRTTYYPNATDKKSNKTHIVTLNDFAKYTKYYNNIHQFDNIIKNSKTY